MQRIAALSGLFAVLFVSAATPATAGLPGVQVVSGAVGPTLAVDVGGQSSGTASSVVLREMRGDTLFVMVIPSR